MLNGVQQGKSIMQSNTLIELQKKVHSIQAERLKVNIALATDLQNIKMELVCKYGFSPDGAENFIVSASNSDLAQQVFENEAELEEKEKKEDEAQ